MLRKQKHERQQPDEVQAAPEQENARESAVPEKGKRKLKVITSTQQFLPVLDVRNGIIITKSERYFKLMEFSPINFELRSPAEQAAIATRFAAAIRTWPREVHIKVVTTPANVEDFVKEMEDQYNVEESEGCRALQLDQIQLLRKIGQTTGVSRRFFLTFEYECEGGFRKSPTFEEIEAALNKQAREIKAVMEECGNAVISVDTRDYTLSALYACACKAQADVINWPERRAYVIDRYRDEDGMPVRNTNRIPATDFFAPERIETDLSLNYLVIDHKYVGYCFVPAKAYPTTVYGGWLQDLFGVIDDIHLDFWIRKEDVQKVLPKLQFALKNNVIKYQNADFTARDFNEVADAYRSAESIRAGLSGGDDFCYMSTILTIYANSADELKAKYAFLRNHCIRNDMDIRFCTAQQLEAYTCALPFMPLSRTLASKTKRNILATDLGSAYPFTAYELCDRGGVFMGVNYRYGSPVFINHFDNTKYTNGNMLIFGPTGSGKTYTLLTMLMRMRQKGLPVYVIAPLKAREFYRTCEALGGQLIRISPGSAQNINPLDIRPRDTRATDLIDGLSEAMKSSRLAEKIQQLHKFFSLIFPDLSAVEKQSLDTALINTYANFGIRANNNSLIDPDKDNGEFRRMPLLEDLQSELAKLGANAVRLCSLLSRFTSGSAKSFNQPTNVDLNNKFTVIDVEGLDKDEMLPVGMFIALDFIMEKMKEDITQNAVVAIDEMWYLMKASKASADYVIESFKAIRGVGGAVIGVTQNIEDVTGEYGESIMTNSRIKIFLPMQDAEISKLSRFEKLSNEEKNQLRKSDIQSLATRERQPTKGLVIASSNHVFVSIIASSVEHDLITTASSDLKRIAISKNSTLPF